MSRQFETTKIEVSHTRDEIERFIARKGGARVSWLALDDGLDQLVYQQESRAVVIQIKYGTAADAPASAWNPGGWAKQDRRRAYRLCLSRVKEAYERWIDEGQTFEAAFSPYLSLASGLAS